MFWNKEKEPFKKLDMVSNGIRRVLVNAVFKDKIGRWKMLVSLRVWSQDDNMAECCEEVLCDDWYLVK